MVIFMQKNLSNDVFKIFAYPKLFPHNSSTKYYKKGMLIKIKKMLKSNLINTQKLLYHFAEIRDPNS